MFMIWRIGRRTVRAAARSGGQRRPGTSQKPAGPPMTGAAWTLLVIFLLAGGGLTAVFKGAGVHQNGEAFLMAFGVLVLVLFLLAAMTGGGKRRAIPADEVRAAYARQQGPRLPAEMEAADEEARAWKAAHPEAFGDAR